MSEASYRVKFSADDEVPRPYRPRDARTPRYTITIEFGSKMR
jgi:hypothetical protein